MPIFCHRKVITEKKILGDLNDPKMTKTITPE